MNILICGDSFSVPVANGWANQLTHQYSVTNLSQAGISEYKILKQLQSIAVANYDCIIVSHTSVSRVHIKQHPVHTAGLHKDCDLIYSDLASVDLYNPVVLAGLNYFKYIFDTEYYADIYKLLTMEIWELTKSVPTFHMTFFDNPVTYPFFCNYLNNIFKQYPGSVNHLNEQGNQLVFNKIAQWIDSEY